MNERDEVNPDILEGPPPTPIRDAVAVAKHQLQVEGVVLDGACGAYAIVKRAAQLLGGNARGYGALFKKEGNQCEQRATDIITAKGPHWVDELVFIPTGRIAVYDVLIDSGGSNQPTQRYIGPDDVKVWRDVDSSEPPEQAPSPTIADLPGREEMMNEGRFLHQYYQSFNGLQRPHGLWINDQPDWEGIGAWLFDMYLKARVAGKTPEAAREAYIAEIQRSSEYLGKHRG